jgi:hypothetical protein
MACVVDAHNCSRRMNSHCLAQGCVEGLGDTILLGRQGLVNVSSLHPDIYGSSVYVTSRLFVSTTERYSMY